MLSPGRIDIFAQLEKIMVRAFNDVYDSAQRYKVDMRTGAQILAVGWRRPA